MTNNDRHSKGKWNDRSLLDPARIQVLDTAGVARFITCKLDRTFDSDVSEVRMTFKRVDGKMPEWWPGTGGPSNRNERRHRRRHRYRRIAILVEELSLDYVKKMLQQTRAL